LCQSTLSYTARVNEIDDCITEEREEIEKRMKLFGCGKFPEIGGKREILVDDGLASGFTTFAAVCSVRRRNPKELVVAVPNSSTVAIERIENYADKHQKRADICGCRRL
jgi:predicted phosphoribosyltransferase